jgi:transcriptional regulator with XRE-family HTH domain
VSSRSLDENKTLVALGRAIKAFRKEKGLTQEELARRADLHESYISVLESGRRNPTWPTVDKISRGLGISLLQLAQRADELQRKG